MRRGDIDFGYIGVEVRVVLRLVVLPLIKNFYVIADVLQLPSNCLLFCLLNDLVPSAASQEKFITIAFGAARRESLLNCASCGSDRDTRRQLPPVTSV